MDYTSKQIKEIVEYCEEELFNKPKIKFSLDKNWSSKFPNNAGLYAIFDKEKFIYIGETANLRERMKDVRRTANHSFRRKLGKHIDKDAKIGKNKYNDLLESQLNDYCEKDISFTFISVNFGRLEIESYIMQRHEGLLNSLGKRDKIKVDA